MRASGLPLTLRTFQRRLALLKARGEITQSGDTRSTYYHWITYLPGDAPLLYEPEVPFGRSIYGLPLSEASEQILALLNRPQAVRASVGYNRYGMLNLHALLSHNLLPEPAASGRLRQKGVGIHLSVYTPLAVPQLIEAMFELLLQKATAIANPFEQAFFVMVHLPYLQPFDDVNKRVSRLAVNIPLNRHNLAPISFTDVPNDIYVKAILGVYELNRVELLKDVFLWAYERSCARNGSIRQKLGEPDPFRLTNRNEIRDLVAEVVTQQLDKRAAGGHIGLFAAKLPVADRARFTEAVEIELMSLHEGNLARYRVRPSVFRTWQAVWRG